MKNKRASAVKSTQEVEFAVLSSIIVREEYKVELRALLSIISAHSKLPGQSISECSKKVVPKSKQNRSKRTIEFEEGKEVHALGDLLLLVRAASVDVVENIQKWRKTVHQGIPRPYIYENVNYLLGMCEDLNFLDETADLVEWLGFRLLRNPFIVDKSLDDIVSSRLGVNVQDSRSLKYWSSASWHQNHHLTESASKAAVHSARWKVLRPPQPLTKPLASIGPEDDVVDGSRITSAQDILLNEESYHGRLLALKAAQEYVSRRPAKIKLESSNNSTEPSNVYDAIAILKSQLKTAEYGTALLRRERTQVKRTLQDLGNQVRWITLCRDCDRTKDHRVWKWRDMYRQEALNLHSKLVEKLEHCLGDLEGHGIHMEGETDKCKSRLGELKIEKEKQRVSRLNNKREEELARQDGYRKKTPGLRSQARPKKTSSQKRLFTPESDTGKLKEINNIYEDIEKDIHAIITRKPTVSKNCESPETIARQLEEKRQRSIYQKRARIEQQSRLSKNNELELDRRRAENVAMKAEDALSRFVERDMRRKAQLKAWKERMEREASRAMFKCMHEMNGKWFVISVHSRTARGYDLEGLRITAYDPRSSSSFTMTMTLREFNSLGYGRTSGGLGAFCKWLCLLYEKRRRQFRLVWSGAPCPPPLRVRENDQALICIHKEGLKMRNVRNGGYSVVAVYIRADNPSVVSFVVGSWKKNEFLLSEHGVEARCLVLGSDLDVHWEAPGHATIVWIHKADQLKNDDTKSLNLGQRIYSSEIVVNQVRYFLHLHDTSESSYTVNFVPKPKKGVPTPEETEPGANTLVLSKHKVNPYNVHLSSSSFADFLSLTSFEHITTDGEEGDQPKFKWKATISPKWTGKLAKYVRVLRLAKYACKMNGLFCFIAIFIVQQKTEFRAHLLLEITWLSPTLPSSFGGEPKRQSLRIALSDYLRCGNASRRFGLHYEEIEGEGECSSCLVYTMPRAKLYENDLAVPDATFDYSVSCSNCALIQYRRLHALQEFIINRTVASELLELIYHGHCDVCGKLVPPIILVLGSSTVLSLLEHYFASFDCSKNGFLHFREDHSITEEGLHVRDSVLHTLARDRVVVLYNADFGMTTASANIFTNELHWWLYPDQHDLPCHLAYIADYGVARTDESEAGSRDFDLIEALRALNLAACRISELEPVHLDHEEGEDDHASAFDAYLVAEAVLIEAARVLLHPEYKWQKPRDIVGASSWSSACSFLLDPVELSGHLQRCNILQMRVVTGDILDAYFAHAKWPHDYPEVRPCFYGLLKFMLHVQHVRHILEMKSGSLQGSSVGHIDDRESAGHERLAKNTSVIDCSQLEHATEIFL